MQIDADFPCPCESGAAYTACCGRFLEAGARPPTAIELMRSRYTAYVLGDEPYLLRTWHADTRPSALGLAREGVKWLGLKVVRTEAGGVQDQAGVVEFVARYKVGGRAARLHEASRFVRVHGDWRYVDGVISQ